MIDWNGKLEAVNVKTGETHPVDFVGMCKDGTDDAVVSGVPDGYESFTPEGNHFLGEDGGCLYRIRNTPVAPTPTPHERAVALAKRIAENASPDGNTRPHPAEYWGMVIEARAIVAALEPVDEDLVEARKICHELLSSDGAFVNGEWDNSYIIRAAHLAVARGRQLQRDSVTGVTLGTREQFEKECG